MDIGTSVRSAGDFNGDGFDDVIIGAPGTTLGVYGSNAGASYIVFGSDQGFSPSFDLATLDGSNGFIVLGDHNHNYLGEAVSSAGDLNDDGFDDIIIGAPGETNSGMIYVYYGSDEPLEPYFDPSSLDGSNGFTIIGGYGDSGSSVSAAGDVNGDGINDILIGAEHLYVDGKFGGGGAFVYYGTPEGFGSSIDLLDINGQNGFKITGINPNDYAGKSISAAGDINNDGFDDIIIGADYADPNSSAYIVYGFAPPWRDGAEGLVQGMAAMSGEGLVEGGVGAPIEEQQPIFVV